MKVMISQPMAGKTTEQVLNERRNIVKLLESQGHAVVDTIISNRPPSDVQEALWYLGASLQKMAECDAVLFMRGWDTARGCRIEHACALEYGLQIISVSDLLPKHS